MELEAFVSDLFEERMHFYKCVFSTWSQNQNLWKHHANFGLELPKDIRSDGKNNAHAKIVLYY